MATLLLSWLGGEGSRRIKYEGKAQVYAFIEKPPPVRDITLAASYVVALPYRRKLF